MMAHFEETLFQDLANIIGQGKRRAIAQVNSVLTLTYWQVGKRINEHVLQNNRAAYGKEIVVSLSKQLENAFGRSYTARNLRRMMQFAEEFPDLQIVTPLATQLTWSHFIELLPLETPEKRLFYSLISGNFSFNFLDTKYSFMYPKMNLEN